MRKMQVEGIEEKVLYPIGGGFDIPNASFRTGFKGETIVVGGLDNSFGVIGPGNSFKTALLYYIALTMLDRYGDHEKYVSHYDTEVNVTPSRINSFAARFKNLPKPLINPIKEQDEGIWQITDKSKYYADEWIPKLREFIDGRKKDDKRVYEAYCKKGMEVKILTPTTGLIDSLSMFEPSSTIDMLEKQKKDDGKANTYYMKQGGFKDKFVSEVPVLSARSNMKILMSAHVGKKIDMDANKYGPKETKQLGFMKEGEYIKGVSPKFMYLMSMVYYSHTATVLKNRETKLPEYPLEGEESNQETDLMKVRVQPLRSKAGGSGYFQTLIYSQKEGYLPALSAFHDMKENDRFGLIGNNVNYRVVFMPDVALSRKKVRPTINKNEKLCRALEILQELFQLRVFHPHFVQLGLWMEPEALYNAIIDKGYDWDMILKTTAFAPIDSYNPDKPHHLSIVDILNMASGDYRPYWLPIDV